MIGVQRPSALAVRGGGVVDAFPALDRALGVTQLRQALAPDVEVARCRSRFGGEHAVIHQPRSGSYYRLTGPQADLVTSLDGTRTVAQLAADPGGSGLRSEAAVGRAATVTVGGVPALTDFVYRHGGRWLFTPAAQAVLVPIMVAGLVLTITQRHQFTVLGQPAAATAATLWLLTLLALVVHELGHALAIRHAGRRILGAGFGLYFGNPMFFINSSDMVMVRAASKSVR